MYNPMSEKISEINVYSEEIYLFVSKLINQLTVRQNVFSRETFNEILKMPNVHLFVMQDDNEILVGTTTVGIYSTPTGKKAWIEDVVIDETARGKGYGKKIVEHVINFVRNLGVNKLSLTSNPSRIAANNLYKTLGFEKYETNVYKMKI